MTDRAAALQQGSKRIPFVDIAKAIAIFLVLMGHTVDSDTMSKTVIYSFHMPLFFMLSGFVMKSRASYTKETWKTFLGKRVWTMLFTYLLWGLIYAKFSFKHLLYILWGTRNTLIYAESLTSLWFLPVLFLASVMAEAVNAAASRIKCNRALVLSLFAVGMLCIGLILPTNEKYGYPFGADIAFTAAGFMLIGELAAMLFQMPFTQKPLLSAVCFLVSAGCFIAYFLLVPQDGYVLMANSIYGNPFLFVFISLIGSVMVISFSMLLQCVKQDQKLLPYIGRNTLGIFILHKPVVELLRKVVTKLHFDYNHPVCLFVIPVVTLCVVLPVLYVIQRYAPFLFGKTDFERKKEV